MNCLERTKLQRFTRNLAELLTLLCMSSEVCAPTLMAGDKSREEVGFILAGMREERLKFRTGQCRLKGRWIERHRSDQRQIDDEISIFAAFDGEMRRFDLRQPGWVPNKSDPNKSLKPGITECKFYDTGAKAAYWVDFSD